MFRIQCFWQFPRHMLRWLLFLFSQINSHRVFQILLPLTLFSHFREFCCQQPLQHFPAGQAGTLGIFVPWNPPLSSESVFLCVDTNFFSNYYWPYGFIKTIHFFQILVFIVYMWICVNVCVPVGWRLWRTEEGVASLWARVSGVFKPPDMDTGTQTWVLNINKTQKCSIADSILRAEFQWSLNRTV